MSNPSNAPESDPVTLEISTTVSLPIPEPGFRYLQVPDDILPTALTSEAILGFCRIDGGDFVAEIDEKLHELNVACLTFNKKGSMQVTIKLDPAGQSQIEIDTDVTIKAPKEKKHPTLLYISQHGQLLSRHPDQMELNLRSVAKPESRPLRVVEPPSRPTVRKVQP